jgi:SAM-dependent methyltransferase
VAFAGATSLDAIYDLGISHNKFGLPLPDGTHYPEYATNVTGERALEFLTNFNRMRDRDWSECSFLDLGCSEGSTTFELSQMGSTVYGVEGREDGIRRAEVLKSILGFERTHFSVGNVDHAQSYRAVDGIFNAGVLYHLEDPVACLERCVENARLFVYLDTGHKPRSEAELQNSKFVRNFGRSYKINYKGLELDVVDFAEPKGTAEKQSDGTRRGPRAGIGNDNSVWLSHESAIQLMAKLGFPYHETIKEYPNIPRLRTCFFRSPPKPSEPIGPFLKPLPRLLPRDEAILKTRERDLAYLRRKQEPVLLIGRDPLLSAVERDLNEAGIEISERIVLPGDPPTPKGILNQLTKGKSGLVVVATPDIVKTIRSLVILDRFNYAFSSFALSRLQAQETKSPDSAILTVAAEA